MDFYVATGFAFCGIALINLMAWVYRLHSRIDKLEMNLSQ